MDLKAQMLPHSVRNVRAFSRRAGSVLFSVGVLEKASGLPWLCVDIDLGLANDNKTNGLTSVSYS